jgi:signal transduction histidine kinase
MDNPRTFSEEELSLLAGIADLASIAISHAQLFEQVVAGRERLRSLSRQLVGVQEAERRFLAHELHDHIGQMLTGLQFSLEMGKFLPDDEVKGAITSAQENVGEIMAQVREISLGLRPTMLDDMGLLVCLEWHFERYLKQTGIQVQFSHQGIEEIRFPTEIETTIFRIIQEALTNIARHTHVKEALVSIQAGESEIFLTIQDLGQGFDPQAAEAEYNSVGLGGMRERANLVGGLLEIRSVPGQGTTIEARIPTQNRLERRRNGRNRVISR